MKKDGGCWRGKSTPMGRAIGTLVSTYTRAVLRSSRVSRGGEKVHHDGSEKVTITAHTISETASRLRGSAPPLSLSRLRQWSPVQHTSFSRFFPPPPPQVDRAISPITSEISPENAWQISASFYVDHYLSPSLVTALISSDGQIQIYHAIFFPGANGGGSIGVRRRLKEFCLKS